MGGVEVLTTYESDPVNTIKEDLLEVSFLMEWELFILIIDSNRKPLPNAVMGLF